MKKLGLGKRVLACAASAATLLTGTTALSGLTTLGSMAASAASYDNYAKLLQYSMYFYDGNMCGSDVGSASQFDWRDNCHGSDEVDGGFHDAGDHVKFGLPAGYTASTLGWGYYEFKDSYDALGQTAHLQALTDRFCDFFKASTKLSHFPRKRRTRPDDGHVPAENVPQLGQFVNGRSPDKMPDPCDSRVVLALERQTVGFVFFLHLCELLFRIDTHGTELVHVEHLSVLGQPCL